MTERHEDAAADADSHPLGDDIGKGLLQPLRRRIDDDFSKQRNTSVVRGLWFVGAVLSRRPANNDT